MKLIFVVIIVQFLAIQAYAQQNSSNNLTVKQETATEVIKWYSIEEAWALNQKEPKKIFIDVYTHWCGWCKRMDATTFMDPKIIFYLNKNYYAVKFNAEGKEDIILSGQKYRNPNPEGRRSSHELAAQLLQGQMSYPTYVFLNGKNEKLTVVKGYLQTDALEPILHFFGSNEYLNKEWDAYKASFVSPSR